MREWLIESGSLDISLQKSTLEKRFNHWKGNHPQVDDVSFFGMEYRV